MTSMYIRTGHGSTYGARPVRLIHRDATSISLLFWTNTTGQHSITRRSLDWKTGYPPPIWMEPT